MVSGYEKTIRLLAKSNNRAATALLAQAVNSSHEGVRKSACSEIISARSPKAMLDFIWNLELLDETTMQTLGENSAKLSSTIRTALLSHEPVLQRNGVRAALMFRVYDLIPSLLNSVADRTDKKAHENVPLEELLLRLTRSFLDDILSKGGPQSFHFYILDEVGRILRRTILDFRRSDNPISLRIFLMLGRYIKDHEIKSSQILKNTIHPAYIALNGIVQIENDQSVFQFILDGLNHVNAPGLILSTISNRTDMPFLECLFNGLQNPVSKQAQANLARIHRLEWTNSIRPIVFQLDDTGQEGLVNLIRFSGINEKDAFSIYRQIIQIGKSAGRSAAITELATYHGKEVDEIVWNAAEDSDPLVQAAALRQVRDRKTVDGAVELLQHLDSPYKVVRETVQSMLPEFRIDRFLETFDQLSEEQRMVTFKIVRKIDPNTIETLNRELHTGTTVMKARSLKCVELGKIVLPLEESLCNLLLHGEIPALRVKAAQLLISGKREISRHTLVQAFYNDPTPEVRACAKSALDARNAKVG